PLANREAVLRADVREVRSQDEQRVEVLLSNAPDRLPPNEDYIRFPEMQGIFGARDLGNDTVEITYQLVLDPGGYIPAWLANILLRDAPYFTLDRLRRIVKRPEYQGHYYDYIHLKGPGSLPHEADPET